VYQAADFFFFFTETAPPPPPYRTPFLLAAFLALWAMTARFCCAPARWQKAPAGCLVGETMCWTPCALIFSALLVPLLIFLSDFCGSGGNLGLNYIFSMGDTMCPLLGGVSRDNATQLAARLAVKGKKKTSLGLDSPLTVTLPSHTLARMHARTHTHTHTNRAEN